MLFGDEREQIKAFPNQLMRMKQKGYKDIGLTLYLAGILPALYSIQVPSYALPSKDRTLQHHEFLTNTSQGPAILLHGCKTDFPILLQFFTNIKQGFTILLHGCKANCPIFLQFPTNTTQGFTILLHSCKTEFPIPLQFLTNSPQGPAILLHSCNRDFPILLQFLTNITQGFTILSHGCKTDFLILFQFLTSSIPQGYTILLHSFKTDFPIILQLLINIFKGFTILFDGYKISLSFFNFSQTSFKALPFFCTATRALFFVLYIYL